MSKKTQHGNPVVQTPSWDSLLLICKDCRHRKDGPKHLRAKSLAKIIKGEMKENALQARIVLTGCLKLCPKRAISVAFAAALAPARIAAIKSHATLKRILPLLLQQEK